MGRASRTACARTARQGRAVQVEPMKPPLKAPGTKRLKAHYDEPPFNFGFKFNLRRYTGCTARAIHARHLRGRGGVPAVDGQRVRARGGRRRGRQSGLARQQGRQDQGRGLHWSTFQLNLSRF